MAAITERARFHSLALIVWCLFLVAGLIIVDDYGVSPDARNMRLVTINTLNYVLHDDPSMLRTHNRFYGTAFEAPLFLLTERVLGLEDPRHVHLARHVLTHLWFLIGGFCCYLLARRLSGDRLIALLVMLLFLLSPRLYAHSFFNTKDAAFASAFVMALLFASRAFDRDSVVAYRWCGAAAGLLVNLRIMGVVLFAIVLVFRGWDWFRAEGPAARAGGFDIYLHGKRLTWVKEACEPGALMSPFRLDLYPADARHVPDPFRKQGYIGLGPRGVRVDGKCLGATRLPDFALARIRLRQSVLGGGSLWEVEVPLF